MKKRKTLLKKNWLSTLSVDYIKFLKQRKVHGMPSKRNIESIKIAGKISTKNFVVIAFDKTCAVYDVRGEPTSDLADSIELNFEDAKDVYGRLLDDAERDIFYKTMFDL